LGPSGQPEQEVLCAVEATAPPEVRPLVTSLVATPRLLAAAALGPLIALGFQFLELLVVF
jgi:hypothetical protein